MDGFAVPAPAQVTQTVGQIKLGNILKKDMMDSKSQKSPFLFYLYLLLFFATWAVYAIWIYPWKETLGNTTLLYAIVNMAIRLLVWVLPVLLFLRYIDHVDPLEYLGLKQNWKKGVLVGVVFSIVNFFLSMLRFGAPHPSIESITWNSVLSTSIFIGFIEEIPFRGFILQKFESQFGFWMANLLSSLLFLGIHLPGWFFLHQFNIINAVSIFLFGALWAILFKYSKSLWSSIIAHSLNDFIAFIVFGL
ncbi:MAG: CPBP family intramembrane glutamic endopeptidase [Anaerolineales bacterium]